MLNTFLEHRNACRARYRSVLSQFLSENEIQVSADRQVEDGFRRLKDLDTATAFCTAMNIPGALPEDYLHRLISIDSYGSVVAGLRFRNLLNQPVAFLQLSSWAFDLPQSLSALRHLFERIAESFPNFEVKGMRWYSPHGIIEGGLERYIEHTLYGKRLDREDTDDSGITLHAVEPLNVPKF